MRSTGSSSVAGFEKNCRNAELCSTLTLTRHVSGDAYLLALASSVCESTGIEILNWHFGGQFNIGSRGAEKLPAALLAANRQHLSRTPATDFFGESSYLDTYLTFAGGAQEYVHSGRAAAAAISAE